MFKAQSIETQHRDLIHDIAYDFHGDRMATCSSDHRVKIWSKTKDSWALSASWRAHDGPVWKVTWAHPSYGRIIATCSFDRTASIWEEIIDANTLNESGGRPWVRRAHLKDSSTSVTDVRFAPKTINGLFLTTCSSDGILRLYEAPDVMNLSQWEHQHEVSSGLSCSCLSWTYSWNSTHVPLVAIGSDNNDNITDSPKVLIYEYTDCKFRAINETVPHCLDVVHDIAFAPTTGRSFHLLAIATKNVRIVQVKPISENSANLQGSLSRYEITTFAVFDDHKSIVWRVAWDPFGTTLASSGGDDCVRLWKFIKGVWKRVTALNGDGGMSGTATASVTAASVSNPLEAGSSKLFRFCSSFFPNE